MQAAINTGIGEVRIGKKIVGDGQPSGTAPVIPHVKPNDLHGLIRCHEDQEILREPVAV